VEPITLSQLHGHSNRFSGKTICILDENFDLAYIEPVATRREVAARVGSPNDMKSGSEPSVESLIERIGSSLAGALGDLLASIPGTSTRPQSLAKSLSLNTVMTSRLLKATRSDDPMAVVHALPGPEPLRRFIRAAAKRNASPPLVERAERAIESFEQLIREEGDRGTLDAIIGGWRPDVKEKTETQAKQLMFRGASQLFGTLQEVDLATAVLTPNRDDPTRVDLIWIKGSIGLRRLRVGADMKLGVHALAESAHPLRTFDGGQADTLPGLLLEPFCTKPLPTINKIEGDRRTEYTVSGGAVGSRSTVDIVYGIVIEGALARHRGPEDAPRTTGVATAIGVPSRVLVFDVLVDAGLFARQSPSPLIYRTVFAGLANPNDPSRDIDRLDTGETVRPLGIGIDRFRSAEVPNYLDMLRLLCDKRGIDGTSLRGYRCRIECPVYSSQIGLAFDLPVRP